MCASQFLQPGAHHLPASRPSEWSSSDRAKRLELPGRQSFVRKAVGRPSSRQGREGAVPLAPARSANTHPTSVSEVGSGDKCRSGRDGRATPRFTQDRRPPRVRVPGPAIFFGPPGVVRPDAVAGLPTAGWVVRRDAGTEATGAGSLCRRGRVGPASTDGFRGETGGRWGSSMEVLGTRRTGRSGTPGASSSSNHSGGGISRRGKWTGARSAAGLSFVADSVRVADELAGRFSRKRPEGAVTTTACQFSRSPPQITATPVAVLETRP